MSINLQIEQIVGLRDKAAAAREKSLIAAEKYLKEIEEYTTAITVLTRLSPSAAQRSVDVSQNEAKSVNFGSGSIAYRILSLLRSSEKLWWTANEIQDALGSVGEAVKMTSVSPNLSRLKENGDIVREDFKVALIDRVRQKAEAPKGDLLEGNPFEASNDTRIHQTGEPQAQGREAVPGGGP